jgi:hypothetical protein
MSQVSSISHILYVTTGSRGCESALSILKQYPVLKREIHVQDIKLIERPSWLRGVPVLAKVTTREIWEGTASIEQLYYLAGYFSGMNNTQTTSPATQQPWSAYQTNLTLASPTPIPTPVISPPSQAPSLTQPPSSTSVSVSPPATITPSTLTNQPALSNQLLVPPQNASASSNQQQQPTLPNDNNQSQNPDKVQALPLPDELRPKQELVLPPLPKNIKADQTSTQAAQPRLSDMLNQTSLNPPPPNQTPAASIPNIQSSLITKTLPTANQSESTPLPTDEPSSVFTPQEVDQIQRVMFKPKTVNRRRDVSGSSQTTPTENTDQSTQSTVRVFPVREKRRTTVVEKEDIRDYVNANEDDSQQNTLSPIRENTPNLQNDQDEVSNESGGGMNGGA